MGTVQNWRNRILNRFDRALLTGSFSAVVMLFVGTAALIVAGSAVVRFSGVHATRDHLSFVDSVWEILQRAIDPGQLAGEPAWSSRLILLTVTIFGLLLVSTLISIINSTMERRIESARRGRRPVHLHEHVVIIGWNDAASKLLEELAVARIEGDSVNVVVFTDDDPIELLNYISEHIRNEDEIDQHSRTAQHVAEWVTVRRASGDRTTDLLDLARIDEARAVICLLENGNEHRNTRVVLAILATLQLPQSKRRERGIPLHVVAQFDSEEFGQRFKRRVDKVVMNRQGAFGDLLRLEVVSPELVRNKIEVNVVRSRGLSSVYKDLLDLSGDEIYQVASPNPGLKFGDLVASDGCIPIGFASEDSVDLWPDWNDVSGDRAVVVIGHSMQDVRRYMGSWSGEGTSSSVHTIKRTGRLASTKPEKYLFVGQNPWLSGLIKELHAVVPPGSKGTLLIGEDESVQDLPQFGSERITVISRSTGNEPLDDEDFISEFDHVIVLADYGLGEEESDSRVLTDVLACRVHLETRDNSFQPTTVVAELRKRASKHIAAVRMADDLLVSESLTACAMAQFALYPENGIVLRHLLGADSPVFLQSISASLLLDADQELTWAIIRDHLRNSTGEIAIALRIFDSGSENASVIMNPRDEQIVGRFDDVVVLTKLHKD